MRTIKGMKNGLALFVLLFCVVLGSYKVKACTCHEPSLKASYYASEVIFIGQFLNLSEIGSVYATPAKIENFEVLRFIKGTDLNRVKEALKKMGRDKPVISLLSSRQSSCGFGFDEGKYYMVFAYRDIYGGMITTDGCTLTREIKKEELGSYLSEDSNEDVVEDLLDLAKADTVGNRKDLLYKFFTDSASNYVPKAFLRDASEKLEREGRWLGTVFSCAVTIILFLCICLYLKGRKEDIDEDYE